MRGDKRDRKLALLVEDRPDPRVFCADIPVKDSVSGRFCKDGATVVFRGANSFFGFLFTDFDNFLTTFLGDNLSTFNLEDVDVSLPGVTRTVSAELEVLVSMPRNCVVDFIFLVNRLGWEGFRNSCSALLL